MKKSRLGFILSLSLVIAACGQQATITADTQGHAAAFADAQTLPLAVGQAMAVKNSILTGRLTPQNVEKASVATTLIEDFDGRPFYYLTLTTEGLVDDHKHDDGYSSQR
jgi:hypothetical protein